MRSRSPGSPSKHLRMQFLIACGLCAIVPSLAQANHTANPVSVTVAGSLQSEAGCPGDWQPDCAMTHLAYDAGDDVWQGSWPIPAGSYEYKVAINDDWSENYGLGGVANGSNIPLNLPAGAAVKFYYDHKSHWATDDHSAVIATVPGSFQSELGCSGDWQPDCLRSWLQDLDGDGLFTFSTMGIPPGSYEAKVAINESWTENYGAGGAPNGPNIGFSVLEPVSKVTFSYQASTHVLTIVVEASVPAIDQTWGQLKATYR
jgi:hypothetical protein